MKASPLSGTNLREGLRSREAAVVWVLRFLLCPAARDSDPNQISLRSTGVVSHGRRLFPREFRDHSGSSERMKIHINGKERDVADGATIESLLTELQIDRRYCAVERNLTLVPREEHAACCLENGDQIEVVTLVGGG